jgi:oligopeptide transport system ATP-binding protein
MERRHQQKLVSVHQVTKLFPVRSGFIVSRNRGFIHAVDGVSFELFAGEALAIVGESGCGKTTLAKLVVRLVEPTSGSINFEGEEINSLKGAALKQFRRKVAMIFQDPFASLDPRMSVRRIVEEPMRVHGIPKEERTAKIDQLLSLVGLKPEDVEKFPHQFSGGQRQRIAIARALSLSPSLIVADEPTSALDVSVQSKIINLFMELQARLKLSFIFISHDLSVVRYVSNRVIVMYLGKIMESASTEDLFNQPLHPYTMALLSSVPIADPDQMKIKPPIAFAGETNSAISLLLGCRFSIRCPYAKALCKEREPNLEEAGPGHMVSCHFWKEIQTKVLEN